MTKVKLFTSAKERAIFYLTLLLFLIIHLYSYYRDYKEFVSLPMFYTKAEVVSAKTKTKKSRTYRVLKVRFDGKTAYITTTKRANFKNSRIYLKLYPQSIPISFIDYLRGFFLYSKILEIYKEPPSIQNSLKEKIKSQHKSEELSSLYGAIFLATPLNPKVREKMTALGVNHLVALSGFHLGILWGSIFALFLPIYRVLQRRFFPWRDRNFDLGILALGILLFHVIIVGSPASLVRSYVMMLFAWIALMFWIELISFEFLSVVVLVILLINPPFIVNLGFWLSVAGVFYIFLILKHSQNRLSNLQTALILPILIHILMIPVAHSIFPEVSIYQWLSPVLSWLFIPFYPLSILAHLVGYGDIFDTFLLKLLLFDTTTYQRLLPYWFLGFYLLLSLFAVRFFWAFLGLLLTALAGAIYLYLPNL